MKINIKDVVPYRGTISNEIVAEAAIETNLKEMARMIVEGKFNGHRILIKVFEDDED